MQSAPLKRLPLVFLIVTTFLFAMGLSVVFPVLPFIVARYVPQVSRQAAVIGALGASFAALSFFSAPVMGALSDAYGRRPVILLSLLGSAVGYVIFGVGGSLWMLFLGRCIDGLTAGGMAGNFAYVADTTPPHERGKVFGQIGATIGAGLILGPALGGVLAHVSLSAPMFAAAAICLLNLLWGAFVLPESLPPERRGKRFDSARLNPLVQLRGVLAYRLVRRLVIVSVLFALPFTLMQVALPLLARDTLRWGPEQLAARTVVVGVLDILVQGLLLAHLIRRWGELRVARWALGAGALGLLGLAALHLYPREALLYAGVLLFSLGEGVLNATLDALIANATPEGAQGQVQGGAQAFGSLGQIAGPLLGGGLYSGAGPTVTFGAGAALVLMAFGVLRAAPAVETGEGTAPAA